jgi:hypothetical protein
MLHSPEVSTRELDLIGNLILRCLFDLSAVTVVRYNLILGIMLIELRLARIQILCSLETSNIYCFADTGHANMGCKRTYTTSMTLRNLSSVRVLNLNSNKRVY